MSTRKVPRHQKFHELRRSPHLLRSRVHEEHDGDTAMQVDEEHLSGGWNSTTLDANLSVNRNRGVRLRSNSSHYQGFRKKVTSGEVGNQNHLNSSNSLSPQRIRTAANTFTIDPSLFSEDTHMKDSSYYQKRIEDMQHDPAMLMMSGNFSPEKKKDQFIYMKGQILNNRYVIYRKLGSGTFGLTIEAYDQFCNQHVAIKVIKKSPAYFRQAQSEIEILTYLNEMDPNSAFHIVRMLDHFLFQDHQCIVFELLSSSLLDLLHKNSHQGLSINLVCRIGYQLFEALDFLSSGERPVSHCDIKPENVLFEDSNRSALRLIDFGSSCFVDSGKFQNYVQSRYYRAPEVLLGLRYSPQIDMWSVACVLVELYTGSVLFEGSNEASVFYRIFKLLGQPPNYMLESGTKTGKFFRKSRRTFEIIEFSLIPIDACSSLEEFFDSYKLNTEHDLEGIKDFIDLLSKIIVYDPEKRITPALALEHRFFAHFSMEKRYFGAYGSSKSSHTMITRSVSKLISSASSSLPVRIPYDQSSLNNSFSRSMEESSAEWENSTLRSRKSQKQSK